MKTTEKVAFIAVLCLVLTVIFAIALVWSGDTFHFKAALTCLILFWCGYTFWKFLKWNENGTKKNET